MNIQGKAAVITGAGRGVGRATALALARAGCHVLVNYRSSAAGARAVVAQALAQGVKAVAFRGDVACDEDCRAMMKAAVEAFGRLDILVNNAGTTRFIPHGDLAAVTDADWGNMFATNVKGVFQCVRAARPHLEVQGGMIVNLASVAGIYATGSSIPYAASKAAVINMTVSLARALGPGIRVNAVAPGFIEGDWLKEGLGEGYERARTAKAAQSVLGRNCQPEDVAAAILSLITGSDLVTGQTLMCDGGFNIGPRL